MQHLLAQACMTVNIYLIQNILILALGHTFYLHAYFVQIENQLTTILRDTMDSTRVYAITLSELLPNRK